MKIEKKKHFKAVKRKRKREREREKERERERERERDGRHMELFR